VISAAENSNKFQKTRYWNKKSVENVVTLEGLPFIFVCSKQSMHTLQNDVHMLSFPIL
jgi:hypothetical protein